MAAVAVASGGGAGSVRGGGGGSLDFDVDDEFAAMRIWENAAAVSMVETQLVYDAVVQRRWAAGGGGGMGGSLGGAVAESTSQAVEGAYVGDVAGAVLEMLGCVRGAVCARSRLAFEDGRRLPANVQMTVTRRVCGMLRGVAACAAQVHHTHSHVRARTHTRTYIR